MQLKSKLLGLIVLVILFGSIGLTTAVGWWSTTTSKTPVTFATGEAAGQYNPADIRGSYTFGEIEQTFGVPAQVLAQAFALPATVEPAEFQVKELKTLYEDVTGADATIEVESVRLFVALYLGLPYDITGDIYLPAPAVNILEQHSHLPAETSAYLQAHALQVQPQ